MDKDLQIPRVIQWIQVCCKKLDATAQSVAQLMKKAICWRPSKLLITPAVDLEVHWPWGSN